MVKKEKHSDTNVNSKDEVLSGCHTSEDSTANNTLTPDENLKATKDADVLEKDSPTKQDECRTNDVEIHGVDRSAIMRVVNQKEEAVLAHSINQSGEKQPVNVEAVPITEEVKHSAETSPETKKQSKSGCDRCKKRVCVTKEVYERMDEMERTGACICENLEPGKIQKCPCDCDKGKEVKADDQNKEQKDPDQEEELVMTSTQHLLTKIPADTEQEAADNGGSLFARITEQLFPTKDGEEGTSTKEPKQPDEGEDQEVKKPEPEGDPYFRSI